MKYRYKALESRRNPDMLDSPLVLADARGWVAVFVLLVVTALVGLWMFLARVPQTVDVAGTLGYPGGVLEVQAASAGRVTSVAAEPGQVVDAGQVIARLSQGGRSTEITAARGGRITAIDTAAGQLVTMGDTVAHLEPGYGTKTAMQVTLQVPIEESSEVRTGHQVLINVPGVNSRRYGLLRGKVASIAPFATQNVTTHRAVLNVVVTLQRSTSNVSGYQWTSGRGPKEHLVSQTPVSASVETDRSSPIGVVFGN